MNTNHYPSVSVVLPVYNAQDCLKACIESVLSQTLHDFELLVMDDGSTDNSMDIARSFDDERIHVIPCRHDFVDTLNRGICESRGTYIARMDADDLMMPNRLERQVGVMEEDDSVAACFSHVITFGDMEKLHGSGNGIVRYPLIDMLRGNIFVHPPCCAAVSFFQKASATIITRMPRITGCGWTSAGKVAGVMWWKTLCSGTESATDR